jgi:hypothetical protein
VVAPNATSVTVSQSATQPQPALLVARCTIAGSDVAGATLAKSPESRSHPDTAGAHLTTASWPPSRRRPGAAIGGGVRRSAAGPRDRSHPSRLGDERVGSSFQALLLRNNAGVLAKLNYRLPFEFAVPVVAEFPIYGFDLNGYSVDIEIPTRSGIPPAVQEHQVFINEKLAFAADVLTVTFQRDSFNREIDSPIDPPVELINTVLHNFIERFRYVARASKVTHVDFPRGLWTIDYLNDDGSELTPDPERKLVRRRGSQHLHVSCVACDPALWASVFSLPANFQSPGWHSLLLDSHAAIPHVGTAIVLAATALEVFIAGLLDGLVKETVVPKQLWKWIKTRGNDFDKQPSVEEQFDTLLEVITGHSLKEDLGLWEAFQNLKTARNRFVHDGTPRISRNSPPVSVGEALELLGQAEAIVAKIREWVPENRRWWPAHTSNIQIKIVAPFNVTAERHPNTSGEWEIDLVKLGLFWR